MTKKLIDPNRLCMGCMAELEKPYARCSRCGFELRGYERPKNSLPLYEIIDGKYLVGKVIGKGGFGITYIGWDFYQSKRVCIKEYFPRAVATRNENATTYSEQTHVSLSFQYSDQVQTKSPEKIKDAYIRGLQNYMKEAESLSKFYQMPGIVAVRDFFYGNNTAYIVMEYIDGIDMKQYAKRRGGRLSPSEVFGILKEVLKSLDVVHNAGIIHRDISPDNIMLTRQMRAKLIDFGAAKDFENSGRTPILLKHGYAPIEQYMKDGLQGPWTDVYSMCASIYYLLTGTRIPKAPDRMEKDEVKLLQVMGVPVTEAQDQAIRKGLSVQPCNRYQTIGELYKDLYGEEILHKLC